MREGRGLISVHHRPVGAADQLEADALDELDDDRDPEAYARAALVRHFLSPQRAVTANDMAEVVQGIVAKLLALKDKPPRFSSGVTVAELEYLCRTVRAIFLEQPVLLELRPPLIVCGDTHDQFHDLLRLFEIGEYPPKASYLPMGDGVDRGYQSLETVSLLLCCKIMCTKIVFRANHECAYINCLYGFYDDCCKLFSVDVWRMFGDVFNCFRMRRSSTIRSSACTAGYSPDGVPQRHPRGTAPARGAR